MRDYPINETANRMNYARKPMMRPPPRGRMMRGGPGPRMLPPPPQGMRLPPMRPPLPPHMHLPPMRPLMRPLPPPGPMRGPMMRRPPPHLMDMPPGRGGAGMMGGFRRGPPPPVRHNNNNNRKFGGAGGNYRGGAQKGKIGRRRRVVKEMDLTKEWITDAIRTEFSRKQELLMQAKSTQSREDWLTYRNQREKCNQIYHEKEMEYLGQQEDANKAEMNKNLVNQTNNELLSAQSSNSEPELTKTEIEAASTA